MSFQMLFERVEQTVNKAVARMTLLQWALFQFLIGNCDAHGKNFSFFVRSEGLAPAPWYDLVCVAQYFAHRCGIDKKLLKREATRLAKLAMAHAPAQAQADDYIDEGELAFAGRLRDFVVGQASRLTQLASEAAKVKPEFL